MIGEEISKARSVARWTHPMCVLALFLITLPGYAVLFDGDLGVLPRDFGTIFLAAIQEQAHAIADGRLLFWDPLQFGGTPFWPLPNTAPAYPPLLLALLCFGALPGLNLTLLAHLVFGAFGTCLLVSRMTESRLGGLIAGATFLYGWYTQFLTDVLPLEAMALCWLPWAFLCLVAALSRRRWLAPAFGAGLCFAAIPWCGGYVVLLPGFVLAGVFVGLASLRPPVGPRLLRGLGVLIAMVGSFAALAAPRLIPTLRWVPLTDRAEGTAVELAMEGALDAQGLLAALRMEGAVPVALLALAVVLGSARLVLRRRFDWSLPVVAMFAVIVGLSMGPLHRVLFEHVPGFDHIREPRRAWLLMPLVLSMGAGLAAGKLIDWVRGRSRVAAVVVAIVIAIAVGADRVVLRPVERDPRTSLSARIEHNALHRELAARAQQESPFRVHDYADTRPKMKRTADLIRTRLGLASIEGVIGNISIPAYDVEYLGVSRSSRAKLWGTMNVRYVTSEPAIDEKGLALVAEFPLDPDRLHPGTDGPYLYRNSYELPRAYLIDRAILQYGGTRAMWTWMIGRADWDPRRLALLRADPRRAPLTPALLQRLEMVATSTEPEVALPDIDVPVVRGEEGLTTQRALVSQAFSRRKGGVTEVTDVASEGCTTRVNLPDGVGDRFLILAETYAIYPGWRAWVDGVEVPLFQASGPTTAVLLPAAAREVVFRYRPPGLLVGLAIWVGGVLLMVALLIVARGRPADDPEAMR